MRNNCEREAKEVLQLLFFIEGFDEPAESFVDLYVCGEEHRMDEAQFRNFLEHNWERICMGFEQTGKKRPNIELTKWRWATIEERDQFWSEDMGIPRKVMIH